MKIGTTFHCHLDVRGYLSKKPQDFKRAARGFKLEDGRPATPEQVRKFLFDHLAQGHEVIPLGEPCEGFDWKTGCIGHPPEGDKA